MMTEKILHSGRWLLFVCMMLQAAAAAADSCRDEGLLWEIRKPGVAPGYLFGTIHSEDPEVLALAEPVAKAYAGSRRVVLEVMLDRDSMAYASSAMLMSDGRLLSDILGDALFSRAAAAMQTRGISAQVLGRMKPWAVAVTLAMPAPQTGIVLDQALFRKARVDGKPVFALETIQEQLDVFEGLSRDEQVALLRDTVDLFAEVDGLHQALLAAWKRRDLAAMLAINDAAMASGDRQLAETFQRRLLIERNRRMAERLREHLDAGGAFVAVGALHLPGEQGLLNLLEDSGYRVSRLY
jgi:hypothetical protein